MTSIKEIHTPFGCLKIVESKEDGTLTYYQGECRQSQVNDEGVSTFPYVHIICNIIQQSSAKSVLMIGCAGGSIATMLHFQGYKVTVVDINPHAFDLARKFFEMPEAIECIVDDGFVFVQETERRFDCIVVDAFGEDTTVPSLFLSDTFSHALKNVLMTDGLIIMNAVVADDLDDIAELFALNMELIELPAILFDWPGKLNRNTVVACGAIVHIQIKPHWMPKFIRSDVDSLAQRSPKRFIQS